MAELSGKIALVTGASLGIGRETALGLARKGAVVALAARSGATLATVEEEIRQAGGDAASFEVDLAEPEGASALVGRVEARLGSVDILINNAARIGDIGFIWEQDPVEWEKTIQINLAAPFRLAKAALPGMLQRGWGRIINVSSGQGGQFVLARSGVYLTTKAGLDLFTRQLGIELQETGVNSISFPPGPTDTPMQTYLRTSPAEKLGVETKQVFEDFHASGKLFHPSRPAALIVALAGESGAAYNGQVLGISSPELQHLLELE